MAKAKADVCTRLPPTRAGGRRGSRVEEVPATAREVLALAGRLLADRVELVVMEATSDYWRVWYYLLEGAGLRVQLVNSRHARQLAGRPKTDLLTELLDVSAAQKCCSPQHSIAAMSGRSQSPIRRSLVVSPSPQKPDIRALTSQLPSPRRRSSTSATADLESSCSTRDLLRHANPATRLASSVKTRRTRSGSPGSPRWACCARRSCRRRRSGRCGT